MHIIIIGNGIAGISAANEIRKNNSEIKISIISKEWDHFFSRTALMYEFIGQLSRKDIEPYERNYYEKMDFNRISDEVKKVNSNNSLELISGDHLSFDKLIICSGSKPTSFPLQKKEHKNVGHFVTINDLEWLKIEAKRCKEENKEAVIIGGGLIGIETAEILNEYGIKVNMLVRDKWYWPIALNKDEANLFAKHYKEHHINVLLETEAKEFIEENNEVTAIKLSNGEILEVGLVLITIGVLPNTNFLEDSDVKLSEDRFKAIEVNEFLETSHKDIYAAGDCANVTWFNGVRRPEQLWYSGRDQGKIAGQNVLGGEIEYKRGTLYNSAKFLDIEYTTAGLVNFPIDGLEEWYQEDVKNYRSQRVVIKDNKVIGFNMLGSRWNHEVFIKWINEERNLEFVLANMEEARFDAEFSTRFEILETAARYAI